MLDDKLFLREKVEHGERLDNYGELESISREKAEVMNKNINEYRLKAMKDRLENIREKGYVDMDLK